MTLAIAPHSLDLGTCTCDLTANKCDAAAQCTCDPDCTAADLAIFAAAAAVASPASYLFNPPALPNVCCCIQDSLNLFTCFIYYYFFEISC